MEVILTLWILQLVKDPQLNLKGGEEDEGEGGGGQRVPPPLLVGVQKGAGLRLSGLGNQGWT